MAKKYLDYSGVELLWKRIKKLTENQIGKIEADDGSISVRDKNKIKVNISKSEGNSLELKQDGLYASRAAISKLTFGADKEYVYDGTEDVTVPVYMGEIE